eukprot:15939744-Heterocapsa_arctica.AAC.1
MARRQGAVQGGQEARQAVPVRLKVWLHLETIAMGEDVFWAALALTWLLCTAGVLRFAHYQRSRIDVIMPNGIQA